MEIGVLVGVLGGDAGGAALRSDWRAVHGQEVDLGADRRVHAIEPSDVNPKL